MSIDEAAKDLTVELKGTPWFTGVGIGKHEGKPCLYLYVSSPKKVGLDFLAEGWQGFHVEIRKMDQPRPLTSR